MKRRLNLFRQLAHQSVVATTAIKPKLSLDKRLVVGAVSIVLFLLGVLPMQMQVKRAEVEKRSQALEMEAEIAQITRQAEERAKQVAENRQKEKERLAAGKSPTNPDRNPASQPSPGLNETWTSILWKLTTFTPPQIVIDKLELTKGAGATTEGAQTVRQAAIEGQATSIAALQRWLEGLALNLPNSDFLLDRQATANGASSGNPNAALNSNYPITFKVTARFI